MPPRGQSLQHPDRRRDGARSPVPSPLPAWWPFTPAETRVAELLATRHSRQQVAALLGVGYETVQSHVRNMGQALRGTGGPSERIAAFMLGVGLWMQAHPGASPPPSLLRDRSPAASGRVTPP